MRALAVVTFVAVSVGGATVATADGTAADFAADAKLFYRVVGCGGLDAVPSQIDAKVVDAHCADLAKRTKPYVDRYVAPASEFIASIRPAGLPGSVVYPFGGGDLASALIAFPDATEITTISLENSGDPTRLGKLTGKELKKQLATFRFVIGMMLKNTDSKSDNLRKLERGPIPGQLGFFIVELAVLGYEPIGLKYFRLDEAGAVVYLTDADVAASTKTATKKHGKWVDADYSEAFTNMELSFRKAGDAKAPVIVHRHIAANLADGTFDGSPLEAHLVAKGKIAAITKAASYLLWRSDFSKVRDYLLAHMAWMVSDSTGIPPRYAKKAGFEQVPYGAFAGSSKHQGIAVSESDDAAFRALWQTATVKKLAFRFGYYGSAKTGYHLLVTRPASGAE